MLPPHLHLIWLSGMPPNTERLPYRQRLLEWRQLNPSWSISLWSDVQDSEQEQLQQWCVLNAIALRSVSSEVQWGGEYPIFKEESERKFYVTASDLLRLRVLYQWGGFYADFDVLPRRLPSGSLPLGIALVIVQREQQVNSILPHAIASYSGHPILQMALWEAQTNFQLMETLPNEDYRGHEDPSYRYGAALALTGDLFRPALSLCLGAFPQDSFAWTAWMGVMQIGMDIEHLEDNSWLNGERPTRRVYPNLFMEAKRNRLARQRNRPLTSILHLAAAYGSPDLISTAAKYIQPFEDYFGHTPKGLAQRFRREPDVLSRVPDV